MSTGKRRVFVALSGRDKLSLGENRARLGSEAYHWAILIAPKKFALSGSGDCDSFDVTNNTKGDPHRSDAKEKLKSDSSHSDRSRHDSFDLTNNTKGDAQVNVKENPNDGWNRRHKHAMDPAKSGWLLVLVMIGKIPESVSTDDIAMALQQLPLPSESVAGQNGVWWTKCAIEQLQSMDLAEQFDVNEFEINALAQADAALAALLEGNMPSKKYRLANYTKRPI